MAGTDDVEDDASPIHVYVPKSNANDGDASMDHVATHYADLHKLLLVVGVILHHTD